MRGLIQRVNSASVTIGDSVVASIDSGLLLFLGIEKNDCEDKAEKLLNKVLKYRVFADSAGKMNQCLLDKEGDLLIVSQFTLAASTDKGLRPNFTSAASTEKAKQIYDHFLTSCDKAYPKFKSGIFGDCLLYTSPSPRDSFRSRMPSSA